MSKRRKFRHPISAELGTFTVIASLATDPLQLTEAEWIEYGPGYRIWTGGRLTDEAVK